MLATLFTGKILSGIFANVSGLLVGFLAGSIIGFMLGKGVNPITWVTSRFSNKPFSEDAEK